MRLNSPHIIRYYTCYMYRKGKVLCKVHMLIHLYTGTTRATCTARASTSASSWSSPRAAASAT